MTTTLPDNRTGMDEVDRLIQEGNRLQQRLGELGGMLRQVADGLDRGAPPSSGVAASIIEISKAYEIWHDQAQRAVGGQVTEPVLPRVLEALSHQKRALEQAQLRQKALATLEQVSGLAYHGSEEFMPLSTIQFDALGLMRGLKDAPALDPTGQALALGNHAYNRLIRLLTNKDMSNEEWMTLYQQVGQELGPEIAVAAARNRIYLPD